MQGGWGVRSRRRWAGATAAEAWRSGAAGARPLRSHCNSTPGGLRSWERCQWGAPKKGACWAQARPGPGASMGCCGRPKKQDISAGIAGVPTAFGSSAPCTARLRIDVTNREQASDARSGALPLGHRQAEQRNRVAVCRRQQGRARASGGGGAAIGGAAPRATESVFRPRGRH
jgi:hypothetical protein